MTDTPKPQRKGCRSAPYTPAQACAKDDIELKEEELKRVTGGATNVTTWRHDCGKLHPNLHWRGNGHRRKLAAER
jgi:hypothetical protein